MADTLYSYVRRHLDRVALDTFTTPPATPYAVVWDKPGGVEQSYQGGAETMSAYPCVTLYDRAASGERPEAARKRLMDLATQLLAGYRAVDTHSDGVTPFIPRSVRRGADFAPQPDPERPGQFFLTLQFVAYIYRP